MNEKEVIENKNNKDFVLKAVSENGKFLDLVSPELQDDKEVVMTALGQDAEALEFASLNLKNDKEVIMKGVEGAPWTVCYASETLREDKDVIKQACKSYGQALYFASKEIRDDREIVKLAVENKGIIIKYASERLITDISTNASLITPEKVELLNQLKLKMIHVSLDGDKLEHESVRGNNTYDRTIRGLEALRKSVNKVRIGSVIHSNNQCDLESLILDSVGLEADEIIFSIMEPVAGQDKSLVKTIPNEVLISQIDELREKYNGQIIVNYNFGKQPNFVRRCPAGDKFIYINNFGNVSPCPWVLESDKTCITTKSLRDKSLEEIKRDKVLVRFLDAKSKGKCYGKI